MRSKAGADSEGGEDDSRAHVGDHQRDRASRDECPGAEAIGLIRQRTSWLNRGKITEALSGSWMCTSEKARTHLGWSPAATLPERLHETVQWYREARWL